MHHTTFTSSAHSSLKFCSQLQSVPSDNCSAYGVDSHVLVKDHTLPVGCLPAVSHGSFDVLATHMLLNSQSVWRSTQFNLPPRDTRSIDKQAQKLKPESAGKQWFDLPAQQLTDETRRDLKLLQLRGTFDPKRFYKSSDHKKGLPKFFQIGTVVEASADFYSGMLKILGPCCCKCMILLSDV